MSSQASSPVLRRYAPIDAAFFAANRDRLRAELAASALAVLNANDILPTNADGTLPFKQNSDLFYLTGIDQEESILLLFPDAPDAKHREILFLKETSDMIAVWEGAKYTKEQARAVSGVENIQWLDAFDQTFRGLMAQADLVYLNANEHARAAAVVESRDERFIRETRRKFPLHRYRRLAPILEGLRIVKSEPELELIRKAIDITEQGFRRSLRFIRPGVAEFEIEAEFAHEFIRRRGLGFAYSPIIASGENACVLHYIDNSDTCEDGELLLMDVGACYAHYNADMTRTVPVSGRFTERQRAVYDAVLRTMRGAIEILRPGVILREYQKEVEKMVESELISLQLLDPDGVKSQDPDKPLLKKYFMHGTSHHLGLDVHDVGPTWNPIQPGMVLTVEPGIYIRDEKIGVRLETNVLIGEGENIDLMASIPIEADEIESLMQAN